MRVFFVLSFLGFRVSSIGVVMGLMPLVLLEIMVSQPMLLLVGAVAGVGKSTSRKLAFSLGSKGTLVLMT